MKFYKDMARAWLLNGLMIACALFGIVAAGYIINMIAEMGGG